MPCLLSRGTVLKPKCVSDGGGSAAAVAPAAPGAPVPTVDRARALLRRTTATYAALRSVAMLSTLLSKPILVEVTMATFPNVTVSNHPVVQHKLAVIRAESTTTPVFRQLLRELSFNLGWGAFRNPCRLALRFQQPPSSVADSSLIPRAVSMSILNTPVYSCVRLLSACLASAEAIYRSSVCVFRCLGHTVVELASTPLEPPQPAPPPPKLISCYFSWQQVRGDTGLDNKANESDGSHPCVQRHIVCPWL